MRFVLIFLSLFSLTFAQVPYQKTLSDVEREQKEKEAVNSLNNEFKYLKLIDRQEELVGACRLALLRKNYRSVKLSDLLGSLDTELLKFKQKVLVGNYNPGRLRFTIADVEHLLCSNDWRRGELLVTYFSVVARSDDKQARVALAKVLARGFIMPIMIGLTESQAEEIMCE